MAEEQLTEDNLRECYRNGGAAEIMVVVLAMKSSGRGLWSLDPVNPER